MNNTKTIIYNDGTFFDTYFKTTSEKEQFLNLFSERIQTSNEQEISLLDLGCFNGNLTRGIINRILNANRKIKKITAVEPSSDPLQEFRDFALNFPFEVEAINKSMEEYLESNLERFDWVICSHSLYWMDQSGLTLTNAIKSGKNCAIVIRDGGLLHQIERKFRPLMTNKKKWYVSSDEIKSILNKNNLSYVVSTFESSLEIPSIKSKEFKVLVGFLLDLTLEEINDCYLNDIYSFLKVENNFAKYNIDVIWTGEVVPK